MEGEEAYLKDLTPYGEHSPLLHFSCSPRSGEKTPEYGRSAHRSAEPDAGTARASKDTDNTAVMSLLIVMMMVIVVVITVMIVMVMIVSGIVVLMVELLRYRGPRCLGEPDQVVLFYSADRDYP